LSRILDFLSNYSDTLKICNITHEEIAFRKEHDSEMRVASHGSETETVVFQSSRYIPDYDMLDRFAQEKAILESLAEWDSHGYPYDSEMSVCLDHLALLGDNAQSLAKKERGVFRCWNFSPKGTTFTDYCKFEGEDVEDVVKHRRQIKNAFFQTEFEKRKGVLNKAALQHSDIAKEVGYSQ